MAYCDTATVLTILPGLPQTTSAVGWSTTIDVVSSHITRSDGIIDGYCARRYSLPFSPVPPMIRTISEDITTYYIYRSFFTQDNHNRMDYFEELYRMAREDLEKIRDGEIDLVDTSGSDATLKTDDDQSLLDSTTKDYQSYFDIDDAYYWDFDQDLKDSVNDAR